MDELLVRECRDLNELAQVYAAIGRQFGETWDRFDTRLEAPKHRFDADRELMLAVVDRERICGGIIAFGDDVVTVRAIGVDLELRGRGIGRRLLEIVEARALARGAHSIVLGAVDEARGFYERLGYRGKRTMREKQLPLPGVVRDRLAARLAEELGDLATGASVTGSPSRLSSSRREA
ncbi:MAG TPA: GNAT family N-acetyltransferase [Acidimicrobiales bacterium]|nr:GNAT family N-acetyltransferase [Acidimicrobiales bacterium]